jgi:hypothetical protein
VQANGMVKLQEVSYQYERVMFGEAELDFTNQITEVLGISVPDDAIGSDTMRVQLAMVRCAPGVDFSILLTLNSIRKPRRRVLGALW